MSLVKQIVDIVFRKGLDTGTEPKIVIPSKFTQVDNMELDKYTTFRRRPGYTKQTLTAVTGSAGVVNIRQLHSLGMELLLEADSGFHSFLQSQTVSRDGIKFLGDLKTFERAQVDYVDIAESQQDQREVDAAYAAPSGLECWVWAELVKGTTIRMVFYRIIDSQSRAIVQEGVVNGSPGTNDAYHPRVVVRTLAGASTFYIYYVLNTAGVYTLMVNSLTVNAAAFVPGALSGATNALGGVNQLTALGAFDAVCSSTTDRVILAYSSSGGTAVLRTNLGSDGVTSGGASSRPATAPLSISVATVVNGGIEYCLMALHEGTNFIYCTSDKTLAMGTAKVDNTVSTPTSPGRIAIITSPFNAARAIVFFDYNPYAASAVFPNDIGCVSVSFNGAAFGTPSMFAKGVVLAARPVAYYGTVGGAVDICVPAAVLSDLQPTVFMFKFGGSLNETNIGAGSLIDASHVSPRVLARLFSGECGHLKSQYSNSLRMPTCLAVP